MAKTLTQIKSLARAHTDSAITVLAAIMNKQDAPESARVAAANSLLDRGWGKAEATLTAEVTHNYVAQLPELVKSLDTWQEQQKPVSSLPN